MAIPAILGPLLCHCPAIQPKTNWRILCEYCYRKVKEPCAFDCAGRVIRAGGYVVCVKCWERVKNS